MQETIVVPPGYSTEGVDQLVLASGKSFQVLLAGLTRIGCVLVGSAAVAVLCGWIFDIPRLTRLLPGLAFMKINTACALLLASIALWLLHTHQQQSSWFHVARWIAAGLVALGALTLSEHIFGVSFGIDQHIPSGASLPAQSGHF